MTFRRVGRATITRGFWYPLPIRHGCYIAADGSVRGFRRFWLGRWYVDLWVTP